MDLRATLSPTPENPTRLGRYTLYEIIGEGGMARVFRADMEGVGGFVKPVALKVIRPHLLEEGGDFVPRFMDEARLGGSLSHPNIVSTLEFGSAEGLLYIAMEFVDGPTLHDVLRVSASQGTAIPLGIALELTRDACAGLNSAHHCEGPGGARLGVVHRDIKPSNLLISKRGHLKVADFGIARAQGNEALTLQTGVIRGTLRYLSPEQAWGKRGVDLRSDLFSLCALLFEMLTLRPLFNAESVTLLIRQTQDCDFGDALEHLPPDIRQGPLRNLLNKGLQKDPGLRYQSGAALIDALDAILDTLPRVRVGQWLQALDAKVQGELFRRRPLAPLGTEVASSPALSAPVPGPLQEMPSPEELPSLAEIPLNEERLAPITPPEPPGVAMEMDAYPIVGALEDGALEAGEEGEEKAPLWAHPLVIGIVGLVFLVLVAGWVVISQGLGTSATELDRARKAEKAAMATPTPLVVQEVQVEKEAPRGRPGRGRLRAPVGPGVLTVKCLDACTVRVDGRVIGAAPIINHTLKGGPHSVKVSWLDGFGVETEILMLKESRWKCVGDRKAPSITCEDG